jgi:hypothetical protein
MSNRFHRKRAWALILAAACVMFAGGCDVLGRISGAYRGPVPDREAIVDEVVIVRSIASWSQGVQIVADRVRYLEAGKFHDVNRVVRVQTATHELVTPLNLVVGDRVAITTNFAGVGDAAEMTEVPDWPGHDFYEYPIGVHVLTSIRRTVP